MALLRYASFSRDYRKITNLIQKERQMIVRRIIELDGESEFVASDEMLAAIDEGLHSLRTEPTISIDDLREQLKCAL